MTLFGLTGGVGMGKSTAGELLQRRGVAVIDTDIVAREVVEPGRPALREIADCFGERMIRHDGRLDREGLANIVFADPKSMERLESILHPRIRDVWRARVAQWNAGGQRVGVVIIPLLFETGAASLFDGVVCLACSAQSQFQRLSSRGWDPGQIRQRLAAQWTIEQKINQSNYVIWTDTTLEAHAAQLERVFVDPISL
jgi:dephospho-CoA kinase